MGSPRWNTPIAPLLGVEIKIQLLGPLFSGTNTEVVIVKLEGVSKGEVAGMIL
jgi:hypothetical protein